MKQRILFIFAIILFLVAGVWHTVLAVNPELNTKTVENTKTKIEYALPYPGVLPDHPLYILKRLRDFILEQIIAEPVKKGEFYILQGDKRLQMSVLLITSGKHELAETTTSKAEKYMEKAVSTLLEYQKTGATIPVYVIDHLHVSLAKHEEILSEMLLAASEEQKNGLTESLTRVTQLIERAKELQ
ncbi:MAG: DUF5667 domain-containing protein [Microgenomates group bacterium]